MRMLSATAATGSGIYVNLPAPRDGLKGYLIHSIHVGCTNNAASGAAFRTEIKTGGDALANPNGSDATSQAVFIHAAAPVRSNVAGASARITPCRPILLTATNRVWVGTTIYRTSGIPESGAVGVTITVGYSLV